MIELKFWNQKRKFWIFSRTWNIIIWYSPFLHVYWIRYRVHYQYGRRIYHVTVLPFFNFIEIDIVRQKTRPLLAWDNKFNYFSYKPHDSFESANVKTVIILNSEEKKKDSHLTQSWAICFTRLQFKWLLTCLNLTYLYIYIMYYFSYFWKIV